MSFIPGNRCAVDKTMEETFMTHAKSRGGSGAGITGISTNASAYQRWARTTHERSQYLAATNALAGLHSMQGEGVKHKDLRASEVEKSEVLVENVIDAVESFVNPFAISERESLFNLSSGAKVDKEIEKDILNAEDFGHTAKESFIEERLKKNEGFFNPIKRLNLKTMASASKKMSCNTKTNKVVELKQQGNIAFQLLVKLQGKGKELDLEKIMKYQLTPVPSCLGTPDGYLNKTNKATGFHFLTKEIPDALQPDPADTLVILDGNALYHSMVEVPENFRGISNKLFSMLPKTSDVIFSTDSYIKGSIKDMERKRRGAGEAYLLKGPSMKRPADWKGFLSNSSNKEMLTDVVLDVLSEN